MKTTTEGKKLLKESIDVWQAGQEQLLRDFGTETEIPKHGTRSCPLCQKYYKGGDCVGCPIPQKTGAVECCETPYHSYSDILTESCGYTRKITGKILDAHEAMLSWMQDLYNECEVEEERTYYKQGDTFKCDDGDYAILAAVGVNKCCLVSLSNDLGNRYSEVYAVNSASKITENELKAMAGTFKLHPVAIEITEVKTGK